MFITPSFKKSLIVEQFQGNYPKLFFTSRKSSVFRTRQQVDCEMLICRKRSEHLVKKNLSLVVFDSNCSFKTVKCSFSNQVIVYQSFYGAPLMFNYVLLQGKFLCFGTRWQVAREMFVQ